jgi:rhodanese-related sulfurtransferase
VIKKINLKRILIMNVKKLKIGLSGLIILSLFTVISACAVSSNQEASIAKKKQTELGLYLDASEAYKKITDNADKVLFIDVRTRAEINFLGMPESVDANIPYMNMNEWYAWNDKKQNFKLEVNSQFVEALKQRLAAKGLTKNDTVILMCRSGSRSAKAVNLLAKNGFTQVYTVIDGYEGDKSKAADKKGQRVMNGWKNAGLPWSYKLNKDKMYVPE